MDYSLAPIGGNAAHDVKREKGNQESPKLSLLIATFPEKIGTSSRNDNSATQFLSYSATNS